MRSFYFRHLFLLTALSLARCFSSPPTPPSTSSPLGSLPRTSNVGDPSTPPWHEVPQLDERGRSREWYPAFPGLFEVEPEVSNHTCVITDGVSSLQLSYRSVAATPVPRAALGGKYDSSLMPWSRFPRSEGGSTSRHPPPPCDSLLAGDHAAPSKLLAKYANWTVLQDDCSEGLPTVDAGTVPGARGPPSSLRPGRGGGIGRRLRGGSGGRGGERGVRVGELAPGPAGGRRGGEFGARVRCRQVPGDGNCLFHAVSLGVLGPSHDISSNSTALRELSLSLRAAAVTVLSSSTRSLYMQGTDSITVSSLLPQACAPHPGVTSETYVTQMSEDGCWGGGPEIVALVNHLRRPIHVYELSPVNPLSPLLTGASKGAASWGVRRMAAFGSPKFDGCGQEPLCVLSADSRFPNIRPGKGGLAANHFLCLEWEREGEGE